MYHRGRPPPQPPGYEWEMVVLCETLFCNTWRQNLQSEINAAGLYRAYESHRDNYVIILRMTFLSNYLLTETYPQQPVIHFLIIHKGE